MPKAESEKTKNTTDGNDPKCEAKTMEKVFKPGFLLSNPKTESTKNSAPRGYNDPKSESKTMDKVFKRGFLLKNPAQKDKKEIVPNIDNSELGKTNAEKFQDEIQDNTLELPREVLEHIFMFLDPNTIKAVACVCKWWKEVAELPSLWNWAKAKMCQPSLSGDGCTTEELYQNGLQQLEIVESNRLRFLNEIHVFETKKTKPHINELVLSLEKMDNLKTVEFSMGIKTKIVPENLAKLVSSVEIFVLSSCNEEDDNDFWTVRRGNPGYSEAIVPAIMRELVSNEKSKTKSLNINIQGGYILLNVDPDLFARGVMKLENISAQDAGLSQQQGQKILECLATEEYSKLKRISLTLNLIQVRPEIFGEAIGKLTKLCLSRPRGAPQMTEAQVSSMFHKMKSSESALERLTLSSHDMKNLSIRYWGENENNFFDFSYKI